MIISNDFAYKKNDIKISQVIGINNAIIVGFDLKNGPFLNYQNRIRYSGLAV